MIACNVFIEGSTVSAKEAEADHVGGRTGLEWAAHQVAARTGYALHTGCQYQRS